MNFFKYVDVYYFFYSFIFGIFLTYLFSPTPEVIIKYPTPENAGKIIYKDKADVCYKYVAEHIECPKDLEVKELPIQTGDKPKTFLEKLLNL